MPRSALLVLLSALLFQPALAGPAAHPRPHHQASASAAGIPIEDGYYVNKDGQTVHRPAHTRSGKAPAGASAQCRDGSFSFSTHHRGTCSRHGGVDHWL